MVYRMIKPLYYIHRDDVYEYSYSGPTELFEDYDEANMAIQSRKAAFTMPTDTPLARQSVEKPHAAPPADVKAAIADEAKRIVTGARRSAYGTPENNFARIARFWTAYMRNTGRDVEITAGDVSPLMRLMKEARLCETPDHRDSYVDMVGYTLTGAEVNGVAA